MKASAENHDKKDIVDTAVSAEQFKTLVAAVKAAELVEVLRGEGPFTVFAPTDKAFAKIPTEQLEALLKDQKKLQQVLTYHVVPGKVMAADVVKLKSAKTVQEKPVKITVNEGKVKINNANVVKTDIECANGVIHVIDAVLLPPTEPQAKTQAAVAETEQARLAAAQTIEQALEEEFSEGSLHAEVERLQAAASQALELSKNNYEVQEILGEVRQESRPPHELEFAKRLRAALIGARDVLAFQPVMEAPRPEGFPELTPVGEIRVQRYPAYRLARVATSEGEDAAFWTLFKHIESKNIAMTAPVEVSYQQTDAHAPRGVEMAFLYATNKLGETGLAGKVSVADVPAANAVSIGVRGEITAQAVATAHSRLKAWLADREGKYQSSGELRVLGYNSPMVPSDKRYFEVQLPIREASRGS
jgi:uncharacterized surface protein with fasciclin (FAS1) repeats